MKRPPLDVEHARELAADLVRELGELAGDQEAVDIALCRWLQVLGVTDMTRVCLAAVQLTFAGCLIPTPVPELPPGRLILSPPDPERKTP